MGTRRVLFTAVLAAAVSAGAVAVAAEPPGHDDPGGRSLEGRAIALINRANRRVLATHPSCRVRFPHGRPRLVDGGAGPQVASVLGVFRRPATDEERALAVRGASGSPGFGLMQGGAIPRDGVRIVRVAGGRGVALTAMTGVPPRGPDRATFDRCQALVAAELDGLAPTVPGAVARRAKALERRLRNGGRPPAVRRPGEGLAALELVPGSRSAGGIGLAPFDPAVFVEHGLGGTFSSGGGRSRLTLIVPDGVATVDATYPRVGPRARFTRPARFKTTIRRTYKVHENVVLATVERPGLAAFPRMVWRAADGTVVRRVPRP